MAGLEEKLPKGQKEKEYSSSTVTNYFFFPFFFFLFPPQEEDYFTISHQLLNNQWGVNHQSSRTSDLKDSTPTLSSDPFPEFHCVEAEL
jgi:hypothetical protein